MNRWLAAGVLLMLSGLGMLLAMVVGRWQPGLLLSLLSYGLLFAGVFCYATGVISRR
ncbi:MAG: hypothetical protein R3296_03875 [Oleiphilaceae bacterium]|nr:hypothetical protein [Oleiphilaceae bacterium]